MDDSSLEIDPVAAANYPDHYKRIENAFTTHSYPATIDGHTQFVIDEIYTTHLSLFLENTDAILDIAKRYPIPYGDPSSKTWVLGH